MAYVTWGAPSGALIPMLVCDDCFEKLDDKASAVIFKAEGSGTGAISLLCESCVGDTRSNDIMKIVKIYKFLSATMENSGISRTPSGLVRKMAILP